MQASQTLGILVNSERHFDFVFALTEAAVLKGKQVSIHIMDSGLGLLFASSFPRLCPMARITVSDTSIPEIGRRGSPQILAGVEVIPAQKLVGLMQQCDRQVVF